MDIEGFKNIESILNVLNIEYEDVSDWQQVYCDHIHDTSLMEEAYSNLLMSHWSVLYYYLLNTNQVNN